MFTKPRSLYPLARDTIEHYRTAIGEADATTFCPLGMKLRTLPPVVAAAVLMTSDYAGAEPSGGPSVSGCLPEHLCTFDGSAWHDSWMGDSASVWMTPIGGHRVRFAPPAGFRELYQATVLLVAELRPEIRRLILLAHPALDIGAVVEGHVVAPILAEFAGRYHALASEVWLELHGAAATAHGRVPLAQERRNLEADDAN